MALVVLDEGGAEMVGRILNEEAPDNVTVKLFTNNVTPSASDTQGSYTIATVSGYADKTLTGASWTVTEASPASGTATAAYAQQDFEPTTAVTCYGYVATNAAGTIGLWAERFATPAVLGAGGGTISVTPQLTLTTAS